MLKLCSYCKKHDAQEVRTLFSTAPNVVEDGCGCEESVQSDESLPFSLTNGTVDSYSVRIAAAQLSPPFSSAPFLHFGSLYNLTLGLFCTWRPRVRRMCFYRRESQCEGE